MKLEFEEPEVKTSRAFQSQNFDFGDKRVIMSILRGKMYANPIRAICQEVMSNARDANREAGRGDVPITVKLPNQWDENISFKDQGPGISPDRMENVFIKYGNSTKRSDNIQTGGFGLGAKTPFAYSDTFTIVTTTDEDDGRYRRTYIALIDKTQLGAMSEVSCEKLENDEGTTGTCITMGVEKKDRSAFAQYVRQIASHWKVRPNIEGWQGTWQWNEDGKSIKSGNGWKLTNDGSNTLIIIDGIPYTLRLDALFTENTKDADDKLIRQLLSSGARLYFDVGELTVTASREDIDYQEDTIKKIKAKAKLAIAEFRKEVDSTIKGATDLWDASIKWSKVDYNHRRYIIVPKWNGIELLTHSIQPKAQYTGPNNTTWVNFKDKVKITCFHFNSGEDKVESYKGSGWRRKHIQRHIPIDENYLIVEDDDTRDGGRANRLRLRSLFESSNNPSLKVALVQFKDKDGLNHFEKEYNWSKINKLKFSTVPKSKSKKGSTKSGYSVKKVKKLTRAVRGWKWVAESDRAVNDNKGGYYVIIHSSNIVSDSRKGYISKECIKKLETTLGSTVYGILFKYKSKISPQWTEAFSALETKVKGAKNNKKYKQFAELGYYNKASEFLDKKSIDALSNHKWSEDNSLLTWLNKSKLAEDCYKDYNECKEILSLAGKKPLNPKNGLEKFHKQVGKDFPLFFKCIKQRYGYFKLDSTTINELIFYVEMKLKEKSDGGDGSN